MTDQEKANEIVEESLARGVWEKPEVRSFEAGDAEAASGIGVDAIYS